MKKRILALLLSGVLAVSMLAGCSSDTSEETEEEEEDSYDYSEGLTDDGFYEGVTALDYVTLPEYTGIEMTADIYEVSEEEVQEEIDYILSLYAETEEVTDRAVEEGDTVNIDYVGTIDGEEFDGGSTDGEGTTVIIGTTEYIDDFLEQLIGHTPGETIEVEVTFPDDYSEESLQGLDAVFTTTINYIEEEVTPEFTDDFVAENLTDDYGWTTADEVEEYLYNYLQDASEQEYLLTYLEENTEVSEIPEEIITYEQNAMLNYYDYYASLYDMELEDFLNYFFDAESTEEFLETYAEDIEEEALKDLIYQAIAEDAGLLVSDDDVAAYFLEVNGDEDYSELEEYYGIGYIKYYILVNETVPSYLQENASRV